MYLNAEKLFLHAYVDRQLPASWSIRFCYGPQRWYTLDAFRVTTLLLNPVALTSSSRSVAIRIRYEKPKDETRRIRTNIAHFNKSEAL